MLAHVFVLNGRQADLLEVVDAAYAARRLAGRLDRRQKQCDQDADDGNDNQQLDERKAGGALHGKSPLPVKETEEMKRQLLCSLLIVALDPRCWQTVHKSGKLGGQLDGKMRNGLIFPPSARWFFVTIGIGRGKSFLPAGAGEMLRCAPHDSREFDANQDFTGPDGRLVRDECLRYSEESTNAFRALILK
jgi:hypothetical protein